MRSMCLVPLLVVLGCSANSVEPEDGNAGQGGQAGHAAGGAGGTAGSAASTGGAGGGMAGASGATGGSAGNSTTGGASSGGAAGTAGSGGSGGSGGTAPHVVVPCDSAEVGVWEEITPPGVLADADYSAGKGFGVNAFVIDSANTANITLGSDGMGLHRTSDCGASWTKINTGNNAAALDGGAQWSMAIDPVEPDTIYTVSGYGTNGVFKTTNGGIDWAQTLAPEYASVFVYNGFTAQVRIDPTDHLHLVITPHFTCQNGHSETCFLETKDAGATWSVVEDAPSSGEGARITLVDQNVWFSGMGYGGLYRTSNAGQDWQLLTSADSYAYEVHHRAGGKYYLPKAFSLAVSDDGIDWDDIPGSPGAGMVATSETHVFVATGGHCVSGHAEAFNPISSAPLDNPTSWTVDTNYSNHYGSGDLQYDVDHHMLYTSNCLGGFWRVRLE